MKRGIMRMTAGSPRAACARLVALALAALAGMGTAGAAGMQPPVNHVPQPALSHAFEPGLSPPSLSPGRLAPIRSPDGDPAMTPETVQQDILILADSAAPAPAPEAIRVTPEDNLRALLAEAEGGEVFELAPGNYGAINNNPAFGPVWGNFASEVVIRSAEPDDPAMFSGLGVGDKASIRNITLENLVFDLARNPDRNEWEQLRSGTVGIGNAENVTIRDSLFRGVINDFEGSSHQGFGMGVGLGLGNVENAVIEGNRFEDFWRSTVFFKVDGLVFRANEITRSRSDGMTVDSSQNILIEDNWFHDFNTVLSSQDHRDMIQFWTKNSTIPTENVIIRGNVLDAGDQPWTQSIFMRNEAVDAQGQGAAMFYRNILIENNLIHNGHLHGITVGETDGLTIRQNTLLWNRDSGFDRPVHRPTIQLKEASTNVTITGNISHGIGANPEGRDDWTVENNLSVQQSDPTAPNYVDDLFVNARAGRFAELSDLQALPGGLVEQRGLGADVTRFDETPEALTARVRVEPVPGEPARFGFDAGLSADATGLLDDAEADFVWDFGDGTTATGRDVGHVFAGPGDYVVVLTVANGRGESDVSRMAVSVSEPLRMDLGVTAAGLADASPFAAADPAALPDVTVEEAGGRLGARIGDAIGFEISTGAMAPIMNLDEFTMSFALMALEGRAGAGQLMRIHSQFQMDIGANGEIGFGFNNVEGAWQGVRTGATSLLDGAWHDLSITHDRFAGEMAVYLDGVEIARVASEGATPTGKFWGLLFGAGWGRDGVEGLLGGFEVISESLSPAEIAEKHAALDPGDPGAPGDGSEIVLMPDPDGEDAPGDGDGNGDGDAGAGGGAPAPPAPAPAPIVQAVVAAGLHRGTAGQRDVFEISDALGPGAVALVAGEEGDGIRFAEGLELASARLAAHALELTLAGGGVVQLLDAGDFDFAGAAALTPALDFASFAAEVLDTPRPDSGIAEVAGLTLEAGDFELAWFF